MSVSCGQGLSPGNRGGAGAGAAGSASTAQGGGGSSSTSSGGASYIDPNALNQGGGAQAGGGKCGDGALQRSESCDDGNTTSGDGCSRICQKEGNWSCPTPGSPCQFLGACGNGVLTTNKTCDDGNTVSGDGCSADCKTIETGFECRVPGKPCTPRCGDGLITSFETCDDGNAVSGDGCSASCKIEPGYDCSGSPGVCTKTVCGNGKKELGETCDDGNLLPYDGCSATCQSEPRCGTDASAVGACQTVCGDAILLRGSEECDDGNTLDHDGCSHDCKVEAGYTCRSAYDNPPTSLSIPLIARDFESFQDGTPTKGHPDFGHYCCNETKGVLKSTLGIDRKPVWAGADTVADPKQYMFTGKAAFDQWYRDVAGVNQTFYRSLTLLQSATAKTTYAMNSDTDQPWFDRCGFYPLDSDNPLLDQNTGKQVTYTDGGFPGRTCKAFTGLGFGNGWANHNYSFTTELRYWFQYQGNENLRFTGDDDVWVFVNGTLTVDLGGVHNRAGGTVILNATNGTAQVGYGDAPTNFTTIDFEAERRQRVRGRGVPGRALVLRLELHAHLGELPRRQERVRANLWRRRRGRRRRVRLRQRIGHGTVRLPRPQQRHDLRRLHHALHLGPLLRRRRRASAAERPRTVRPRQAKRERQRRTESLRRHLPQSARVRRRHR
ncbi:MAG: DUF4215 domain-containing protein [Polyangiaceae bacterium]